MQISCNDTADDIDDGCTPPVTVTFKGLHILDMHDDIQIDDDFIGEFDGELFVFWYCLQFLCNSISFIRAYLKTKFVLGCFCYNNILLFNNEPLVCLKCDYSTVDLYFIYLFILFCIFSLLLVILP